MLATLGGTLALLAGLAVLLIPLLVPELSRPRDAFWGAVVLLLGLVLVTTADRLGGAPMLAVLCGGLLIGRLGGEVGLGRWRQLSSEEQQRFWAAERWQASFSQLGAVLGKLLGAAGASVGGLTEWLRERREAKALSKSTTKRWVRPEPPEQPEPAEQQPVPTAAEPAQRVEAVREEVSAVLSEVLSEATAGEDDTAGAAEAGAAEGEVAAAPAGLAESLELPAPQPEQGAVTGSSLLDAAMEPPASLPTIEVTSFAEIDALLQAAGEAEARLEPKTPLEAGTQAESEPQVESETPDASENTSKAEAEPEPRSEPEPMTERPARPGFGDEPLPPS